MRVTVNLNDGVISEVMEITGETIKSRAIAKAVGEFVNRRKAKELGRKLRDGFFDYPTTNEQIEKSDV